MGSRASVLVLLLAQAGCYRTLEPPPIDPREDAGRDGGLRDAAPIARDASGPIGPPDAPPDAWSPPPPDARPPPPAEGRVGDGTSFRVSASLSYDRRGTRGPGRLAATLWARELDGDRLEVIAGSDGRILRQEISRDATGAWPIAWEWQSLEPLECMRTGRAHLSAGIVFEDADGDGLADRVRGAGTGTIEVFATDFLDPTEPITAIVEGAVEHDPPTLRWARWVPDHVPLDRTPVLVASEPVTAPTDAYLWGAPGPLALEAGWPGSDAPDLAASWTARSPTAALLPLATALLPRLAGDVRDLTGLALERPPPFDTLPIASAVAREGFEPGTAAHLEGDARIVAGLGSLAAIAGTQSALVEAPDLGGTGGSLSVVRVAVPPGATSIRARFRHVQRHVSPDPRLGWITAFRASVISLAGERTLITGVPDGASRIATGDPEWREASEVLDLTLPLAPGDPREVVVVLGESHGCAGTVPSMPSASILIDDIRAE